MLKGLKGTFSFSVILGMLGIALILFAWFLFVVMTTFPRMSAVEPTAILMTYPAYTSTPLLPTPTLTPLPTATSGLPPSPLPGMMGVGGYVQIYGTDGEGLNIRSAPGLNTDIEFFGGDAEVFIIGDGPIDEDGILWWYLVTPVDDSRAGWAAANYLSVVSQP